MASPSTAPALVERTEIHKSCKSIEALLSILNEYCEAAGAVISLQKKLAKTLKDAASTKATAEIPASAMLASANIFESLSDIDSKFSKVIDREYELISNEVKKWFKKLSKEEKAHDERMASANARIKQAGQVYEKKSKKKVDASEEHARYITLISTLGPEISQEKYNHAATISQRHTTLTYSVAACLSRLADFEWQKSCECVRRFSPTVGPLGSYRSLCEGGWTGEIPPDLPDTPTPNDVSTPRTELNATLRPIDEDIRPRTLPTRITPEPTNPPEKQRVAFQSAPPSLADHLSGPQQDDAMTYFPPSNTPQAGNPAQVSDPALPPRDTLEPPRAPFVDPNTGSVRSLSAFPVPPTHFPIPPAQPPQSLPTQISTSLLEFPSRSPLAESPVSEAELPRRQNRALDRSPEGGQLDDPRPSNVPHSSGPLLKEQRFIQQPTIPETAETEPEQSSYDSQVFGQTSLSISNDNRPTPPTYRSTTSVEIKPLNPRLYRDRDPATSREFGVLSDKPTTPSKSRTVDNFRRSVERTDTPTSTTGSLVSAMRSRYDNNSGSTSPPPRDLPRIPPRVNDIAARYQIPLSPKLRTTSPPVSRRQSLPLLETSALSTQDSSRTNVGSPDEERRRRQQREDSPEVSRRSDNQVIRERELELEARARELDRDRARLQVLREGREHNQEVEYGRQSDGSESGHFGARPQRERRVSLRHQLQRPRMENDESDNTANRMPTPRASPARPRTQESYSPQRLSSNHQLTPPHQILSPKPSHPSAPLLQQHSEDHFHESQSRYHRDESMSNTASTTPSSSSHAPFCGCEKCSVSKYRSSGSGTSERASARSEQQNSPTESKRSEKSKLGTGWIRRLSMPVVNAKKQQGNSNIGNTSNYALGSGIAGGIAASRSAGLFTLDSKKHGSTTGLGIGEDGKLSRPGVIGVATRRSYDLNGVNNRSMTNLTLRQ